MKNLTSQEIKVLRLMKCGLTKKQIAEQKVLSYHTVDTHVKNIYKKLCVCSNVQAITKAMEHDLV